MEATVAASVGSDDLTEEGVSNAVNASGIVVDTSKSGKPIQEIDVATQRIGNEISLALPLGLTFLLRVAGKVSQRAASPLRC